MKNILKYRPVEIEENILPENLKRILKDRYFKRGNPMTTIAYNSYDDKAFIEGLAAAEVEGAKQLLHALAYYQYLEIIEE